MVFLSEKLREVYRWWRRPIPSTNWRQVGAIFLGGVLLAPLVYYLPLLGHDWLKVFYAGEIAMYPPWVGLIFSPFRLLPWRISLALINSLTLAGVAVITACQSKRVLWDGLQAAALALLTPSLWYLLWDGQIDGLILIGMLFLPWSIPIVLLRPQIIGWMLLSRRRWTIWAALWLGVSFVLWKNWFGVALLRSRGSILHPTAMGWATLGWPILLLGIGMLLTAGGNPWRILAGAFVASPYVQPYHIIMLLPALGRVGGWRRWVLWGLMWAVGSVPAFMGLTRYTGLVVAFAVWWYLRHDTQEAFCEPIPSSTL